MNLGHRLGEVVTTSKQNTAERMIDNWIYQTRQDFKYWECDIVETKDRFLVVHHDRELEDGRKIKNMTLSEIQRTENDRLELSDLFDLFADLDMQALGGVKLLKPIRVELKRLYTVEGRERLIQLVKDVRAHVTVDVHCICFKNRWPGINHFEDCFPKDQFSFWKFRFDSAKINVFKIGNHDKDCFGNPIYRINPAPNPTVEDVEKQKKSIWKKIKDFFRRIF